MKQKNFWLKTLNVRSDEGWLVKNLFLLQFLQGAGISFFFTAAFALFLDRFEITELPYVFIYSSFLLWITGFIYSKVEHKLKISQLAIVITIFMSVSILAFRLAFGFGQSIHFLYLMLAWFNVLYLLNNLEFWGIASLSFDLQQSKRLFSVISAGDIPAKFIGYSLALLTVEYIGTINLLWASAACMLGSIPFLISIKRSGKLDEGHGHTHTKHHSPAVSKLVKNFSGNVLIKRLAILSIIVTIGIIIINFAFYAGVKAAFHTDVALAKFIAFFLAFVRIIALIVKTIVTGRLINKLGIIKSLLITPVVLMVLVAVILLTQGMPGYQKGIIYFFGITSILVDILRSSINSPVFLVLMQPLSSHERLRAHTIVKGIMDPFASLIAGVLLLILIHYQQRVDLLSIGYILFIIAVCWIAGIYLVNSQYLKTIIQTISSRYFNKENFTINDSSTLDWLKEKIKKGSEAEVSNIISMLYSSKNKMADELLLLSLKHPSEKVKVQVLQLIQRKADLPATNILLPLLQSEENTNVIAEIITALCKAGVDNAIILPYLDNEDVKIKEAAISGLLNYGNEESKQNAETRLQHMLSSSIPNERRIVAKILGKQEKFDQAEALLSLMKDAEKDVRKEAFLAIGKTKNEELLKALGKMIVTDENEVIGAFFVAGEASLSVIHYCIKEEKITQLQKEKLILLCGRIGGKKAQSLLFDLLDMKRKEYKTVIKAIYGTKYIPQSKQQIDFLINISKKLLEQSAGIIYMQSSLQQHGEIYQLLINSFHLELAGLRESLLYIFALLYNRENIKKVRAAYSAGKKESIMNAMEIVDITVRKDLAVQFNTIFEPGNINERLHSLRTIYPVEFFKTIEQLLNRILAEEKQLHHYWTLACSLYTATKQKHIVDVDLVKKHTHAENRLLRETAEFAL